MKRVLVFLAMLSAVCWHSDAATLNPSASKAYVDKKVAELRSVIEEKSVFTNTLQTIENTYYNTYTNTYITNQHFYVYNVTTNTYCYETNLHYDVTYKTNVIVDVYDTTNIIYNVTTNLDVWVTNNVNVVTNDIVFEGTVYYTNKEYAVIGYTGVVIRAVSESGDPLVTTTNAISFFPLKGVENSYTNTEYVLSCIGANPVTGEHVGTFLCIDPTSWNLFTAYSDWYELGISSSFQGDSLEEATEMTLIYASPNSMSSDTAFILTRCQVGAEERNVRQIRYNQTMAAEFSLEARRLVSDDGTEWLDSTGIWWRVTSDYDCPAYSLDGEVLKNVRPTETHEIARFEDATWTVKCFDRDGFGSPRYLYQLWKPHDSSFVPMEYETDDAFPSQVLYLSDSGYQNYIYAYYCTAVTNGVVRTNAVRRVLFSDDMTSVSGLTKFDGRSISTNSLGELEVYGYGSAEGSSVPVKISDGYTNSVAWTALNEISSIISVAYARNSAWGYLNGYLYNCYIQVGRKVYAVSELPQSLIYVSQLQDGSYGVGVAYAPQTDTYSFTFGLVSSLSNSPLYDTVVFVGTLSHENGQQTWSGIGSIPIVLVFE